MHPSTSTLSGALLLCTMAPVPGQEPLLTAEAFRIPIHASAGQHGAAGQHWAAGPDYKVAFADGVTFYPRLGPDTPGQKPWRWRTAAVGRGHALATAGAGQAAVSPWRYELRHEGWTEAYDVRTDGVEQTFTFTRLPEGHGPLVIRGQVATSLTSHAREDAWQELVFADAEGGRNAVTFGAAWAIDARGNRTPVKSRWQQGELLLTVPEPWLADAALPIVVDPLLSGVYVTGWQGSAGDGAVQSLDVAVETESVTHNLLVAYSRVFAAGDHDVYAWLCDPDFRNPVRVLAEITTDQDDRNVCAAYVARANRWLVGFERAYSTPVGVATTIRVYYHDRANLVQNSGLLVSIPQLNLETFRNPDLGGSLSESASARALLVYQRDSGSGDSLHTEVVAVPIDVLSRTFLSAYAVGSGPVGSALDRERPAVNQVSLDGGWLIAWQELDRQGSQDDWDIQGTLTDAQGLKLGSGQLADGGAARHLLAPRVAGTRGEYLLAFGRTLDLMFGATASIGVRRVDWLPAAPAPTLMTPRTVAGGGSLLQPLQLQGLSADTDTDSHWALSFTRGETLPLRSGHVLRLGGSGAVTESAVLYDDAQWSAVNTAVAYDPARDRFAVAMATDQQLLASRDPVWGFLFTYPTDAVVMPYGTACGPASIHGLAPYAGNFHGGVYMTGTPPQTPFVLLLGAAPATLPLDGNGMPGCSLLIHPSVILATVAGVAPSGVGVVNLALPDDPLFTGDLWCQFAWLAPGLNPAGLAMTRGVKLQVR